MSAAHPTRLRWGLTAAALTVSMMLTQAAAPVFWRVSTQAEFLQGETENVSIDVSGQLRLGPVTELVYETTAPFLWAAERAGNALWVGSGNDGKVFRVGQDGSGREVFDANELNVHAISARDDETAHVGTSPDGAVFRITADGSATTIFDPEEQYIWSLLEEASGTDGAGYIYVATGTPGRIYRVAPDGTSTLFYDTKTTHVLALAVDGNGNLLAGTGSPGRVFRITPDGQGFVVVDSSYSEIRALRLSSDGSVYAVAVSQSSARSQSPAPTSEQPAATATVTVSTSTTVTAIATTTGTSSGGGASSIGTGIGSGSAAGAVYRIMPDGLWDVVWESSTDAPYDVVLAPGDDRASNGGSQTLLIGTGGNGKIYQITGTPPRVVLLAQAPAQQVMKFATDPDGAHYFVTANPGKVYRLSAARAATGSYLSDVRDAQTTATWGTVRWRATVPPRTSVQLRTRTGNTETPNDTWSPWSEAYTNPAGAHITNPKARYIQWKAELSGVDASPTLISVTTAYLPRNLPPQITNLTVHEPGVVFQQPFSGNDPPIAGLSDAANARVAGDTRRNSDAQQSALGRRMFRKGLQSFVWTAQDQNHDELLFGLFYRAEADVTWQPLSEGLRDAIFTWDTTTTPDGTYAVRVVASDRVSNPPGLALLGAIESTPFDIDNSPPEIDVETPTRQDGQTVVRFSVRDAHSPVQRVEYSLDSEQWDVLHPIDGIPDSQVERFEVALESDAGGTLVIRATDAMGNTTTASGS